MKLFSGEHQTKAYPTHDELCDFGRRICGVSQPALVLQKIAQAMRDTLAIAKGDPRIPAPLLTKMQAAWELGFN